MGLARAGERHVESYVMKSLSARYEAIALVLQGGGALGAYQAGVYQGLHEAGIRPNWVSGTSIGAINGALIAGNPPETRLDRLKTFWETVCRPALGPAWDPPEAIARLWADDANARSFVSRLSALRTIFAGQAGFFVPRIPSAWFHASTSAGATSLYDPGGLRLTLERLVDFDRLNSRELRYSVGAVNVRTGNLLYFDSTEIRIRPEHVMASGALPPAFPPVEIDGERYWDGGIVSNTPLEYVLDGRPRRDTLAFQVDLWRARGRLPRDLADVLDREKEIRYSSRTRHGTDQSSERQKLRQALAHVLQRMPSELASDPAVQVLRKHMSENVFNIVHLIYQTKDYEGVAKDYEFSSTSMREHWQAGLDDTRRSLAQPHVLDRPASIEGVVTHDIHRGSPRRPTVASESQNRALRWSRT
jgi:NTE family protein